MNIKKFITGIIILTAIAASIFFGVNGAISGEGMTLFSSDTTAQEVSGDFEQAKVVDQSELRLDQ